MNYEINDYDSREGLFRNNDSIRDNEEEYEFQFGKKFSNIEEFIPPKRISKDLNNLSNLSNNISPYDYNNKDDANLNSNLLNNLLEGNNIASPIHRYQNNFKTNYGNENKNSITLLNLTDKIYENDDHFKKKIINKKVGNKEKPKNKKNKSSRSGEKREKGEKKKNRKSLFIANNNNKDYEEDSKKNITVLKRRGSVIVKDKDKNNCMSLNSLKFKANSGAEIQEIEKNNDTNNEENINKRNKNRKIYKTIKEEKKLDNKKNKLSIEEINKEEKDDKDTTKKPNIINIEKVDEKNINNNEIKEKEINEIKSYKRQNQNKKRCFLFCCLNSNLDEDDS